MNNMKKPGFKIKFDSEKTLYAIILILIFLFIFNMKNIYSFTVKLKNGSLFENNQGQPPVVNDPTIEKPKEEKYNIVTPTGRENTKCVKKTVDDTGTKTTTISLYYTDEKMRSIKEYNVYDGTTDEYTNYIYSEKKNYERLKNDNIELDGFSVVVSFEGNTYMSTSTVVDLSKVALSDIKVENEEELKLFGNYNDDVSVAISMFTLEGFTCDE